MKILFSFLVIFFIAANADAQTDSSWIWKNKNTFLIEGLGEGVIYSLSYERVLLQLEPVKITAQVGGSYLLENNSILFLSFNQLFGHKRNYFETGFGPGMFLNWWHGQLQYKSDRNFYGHFRIGYRYQNDENGFIFRVALTPLIIRRFSLTGDGNPKGYWLLPFVGIGVGRCF